MADPKELAAAMIAQADGLALVAEMNEVVAKHFRPRFEACWQNGKLVDEKLALRLRDHVLNRESEARAWRKEEQQLRDAAAALIDASEREYDAAMEARSE